MDENVEFSKNTWWLFLMRGIILVFFGIAAIIWPAITFKILVLMFALFIVIDGVIDIVSSLLGIGKIKMWFLVLMAGVLEVLIGIFVFRNPGLSLALFIFLIGASFIGGGILRVIAAFDSAYKDKGKVLYIVTGILSVIAGILVVLHPVSGGLAFIWVLGAYALIAGPILIALGFDIKSYVEEEGK